MLAPIRTARRLCGPALLLAALGLAAPASAALSPSKNWAGFLAGGPHKHFRSAVAFWREPTPHCSGTHRATSATWVGLGGVIGSGLEQTGTQLFCDRGRTSTSAWYEVLPAPATYVTLPVRPGDRMGARVTVAGHRVTMTLSDFTRGVRFTHVVTAAHLNTTTAEWVEEAPQACVLGRPCKEMRLANFGTVHFTGARATDRLGHTGPVSSTRWKHVRLVLIQARRGYTNIAIPSTLRAGGTVFSVSYRARG